LLPQLLDSVLEAIDDAQIVQEITRMAQLSIRNLAAPDDVFHRLARSSIGRLPQLGQNAADLSVLKVQAGLPRSVRRTKGP
jgi:hypothetical protein